MAADVLQSEQLLRRFDARATRFFRFPGGCYDRQALTEIARTGVVPVEYDDVSGDAFGTSVAAIVQQTLAGAQPGSIIVMHVTGGNTAPLTDAALPAIVRGIRARGLQLVRLSDLLGYR